MFCKIH